MLRMFLLSRLQARGLNPTRRFARNTFAEQVRKIKYEYSTVRIFQEWVNYY